MESSLEFSNSLGSVSSLMTRCRTFKVLLIGDSGVGKTCLTHRLSDGRFPSRVEATIGVDFRERQLDVDEEKVKLLDAHGARMFCRRAWQRVGPLAWRSLNLPCRSAPVRHMSSGVPGGSSNMTYFILCGGGLTAAVIYAYKSVNGDTGRYEDRLPDTDASAKTAAPATEATPAEEAAPAAEVISEPVFVPAEPVPVAAAELVLESAPEEAADVASEVQVLEAAAEEAAPPVEGALEVAAAEAAPVAMETPAEAHAAESTGTAAVDKSLPAEVETAPAAAEAEAAPDADVAA